MSRKTQLSLDNVSADLSRARFSNTFDIEEGDEKFIGLDEEVVYIVIARVDSVRFAPTKGGEHARVNALKVQEARLVTDEDKKSTLLEGFNFGYKPMPSLFDVLDDDDEVIDQVPVRPLVEENVEPDPDAPEGDVDEDEDEIDREMREFLEAAKRLADEYDPAEDDLPPGESRVVLEAKGAEADDPVLRRFLQV